MLTRWATPTCLVPGLTALAVVLVQAPAFGQPNTVSNEAQGFPGCQWRPAAQSASEPLLLRCPDQNGDWLRVDGGGDFTPQTVDKASAGDSAAMRALGIAYLNLPKPDAARGLALLRKAASRDDPVALRELGRWMLTHGGWKSGPDGAVEMLRRAADTGDMEAMRGLGEAYMLGRGVTTDNGAAVGWYRRAAEKGDAPAMRVLAFMLDGYREVSPDPTEAMRWRRAAAEAGDEASMRQLAGNYAVGGNGLPKDPVKSQAWSTKAAEAEIQTLRDEIDRHGFKPTRQDDPGYRLGDLYFRGRGGFPRDTTEGLRWYTEAAKRGDMAAASRLEEIFTHGESGVPIDLSAAKQWSERRRPLEFNDLVANADAGLNVERLATIYMTGKDPGGDLSAPADPVKGVALLRKAMAANPNDAQVAATLSSAYRLGLGVDKDMTEAKRWADKAAALDPVHYAPIDQVIAGIDKQPGVQAILLSQRLATENRPDEAVFWYYVGQLRGRMEAASDADAAELYGAMFASVGPGVNQYAAGDIDKLAATIDRVLAWDAAHPATNIAGDVRAKQRRGLADLRTYFLNNKDTIRANRAKNGLPNLN